jgi:hypothetical protein
MTRTCFSMVHIVLHAPYYFLALFSLVRFDLERDPDLVHQICNASRNCLLFLVKFRDICLRNFTKYYMTILQNTKVIFCCEI